MSIQPDLQFRKRNSNVELIGFTECTPESVIFDQTKGCRSKAIVWLIKNDCILTEHSGKIVCEILLKSL
jgi:hypothetical protein